MATRNLPPNTDQHPTTPPSPDEAIEKNNTRTDSNSTVNSFTGPSFLATNYLVFVECLPKHPSKFAEYKAELDRLRLEISTEANRFLIGITKFRFDILDTIKSPDKIRKRAKELGDRLKHLEQLKPDASQIPPRTKDKQDMSHPARRAPNFILIGHGLGCWLIRHLIQEQRSSISGLKIVEVLFLDFIEDASVIETGNKDLYREFVRRLIKRFRTNSPQEISGPVIEGLLDIDTFFSKISNEITTLRCRSLPMFLSHDDKADSKITRPDHQQGITVCSTQFERIKTAIIQGMQHIDRGTSNSTQLSTDGSNPAEAKEDDINAQNHDPNKLKQDEMGDIQRNTVKDTVKDPVKDPVNGGVKDALEDTREDTVKGTKADARKDKERVHFARKLIDEEKFQSAVSFLDKIIKERNDNNSIRYRQSFLLRGMAYVFLGHYEDAIRDLNKSVATSADDTIDLRREAERWLGVCYIQQGDYITAVKLLQTSATNTNGLSDSARIALYRNLAIAHAQNGEFVASRKCLKQANEGLSRIESCENKEDLNGIRGNISYDVAEVDLLSGDYSTSPSKADEAWKGMMKHFGSHNMVTLKLGRLKAYLLALNHDGAKAEEVCRTTLQIMKEKLGVNHPITLETMNTMILIFRIQARLSESIDTGKIICNIIESTLATTTKGKPKSDPRWLAAKGELAASYLSRGDYRSASDELEAVIDGYQKTYHYRHHKVLQYLSELSHVWTYMGHFEAAEKLLQTVLVHQLLAYNHESQERKKYVSEGYGYPDRIVQTVLMKIKVSFSPCGRPASEDDLTITKAHGEAVHNLKEASRIQGYTFILNTLRIIAYIKWQKPSPDYSGAKDILHQMSKSSNATLGPTNILTTMIDFDLASVLRYLNQINDSREYFKKVYETRSKNLGESHPDTLAALREFIITNCASTIESNAVSTVNESLLRNSSRASNVSLDSIAEGTWNLSEIENYTEWREIIECSERILLLQEDQLGSYHPQTLITVTWLLIAEFDWTHDKARLKNNIQGALNRLRDRSVQDQRQFESRQAQKKLAAFLDAYEHPEEALDIKNYLEENSRVRETPRFDADEKSAIHILGIQNAGS